MSLHLSKYHILGNDMSRLKFIMGRHTRCGYLSYMRNVHADVFSGARSLVNGLSLYLHPYCVYASNSICSDSSEPSLLANAISTKMSQARKLKPSGRKITDCFSVNFGINSEIIAYCTHARVIWVLLSKSTIIQTFWDVSWDEPVLSSG